MTADSRDEQRPSATSGGGGRPSVLSSTGSMAIATLISRITGFFKILLTAAVLGPAMSSAFISANTLPRTIAEFVLGAVLTAVVIPVLVRAEKEDADGGRAFVRRLFTMATTVFGVATVVSVAGAPWLSQLLIGRDSQVDLDLTTALAYLLLPTVLFYGLTALLTAILNTRSVFKPGAWAPVVNNIVAIATLVLYLVMPGEITLDPVSMGSAKLLVLGLGTTLGVIVQVGVLVPAIRRERISLRPLWGIDPRLKTFGNMALAIIVYVGISQAGLVITTRIAAAADAAGPAIYNFVWLLLQVPYGVLGATLLTAIMPQLSRNAAAGDDRAVVGDLTMATKLAMLALLPVVAFFTFDGPTIGRALFNYGAFGEGSATTLGVTLAASAFTLVPYTMVLLHLRVFYARERAWTPNLIIVGIIGVKTALSLAAPVLFPADQVVIVLGTANGLGFVAGMAVGAALLRRSLGPLGMRSVLWDSVRIAAAAGLGIAVMLLLDLLTGLHGLAVHGRGLYSVVSVVVDGSVMLAVTIAVLVRMHIPFVDEVFGSIGRGLSRFLPARLRRTGAGTPAADGTGGVPDDPPARGGPSGGGASADAPRGDAPRPAAAAPLFSGPGQPLPDLDLLVPYSGFESATYDPILPRVDAALRKLTVTETHAAAEHAGSRGPRLIPGAMVAGGRYRLLGRHGGVGGLQFWKAQDTRLDREVALTFIDADGARDARPGENPEGILTRTLRLARISHPGLARVLDVVRGASGGIVVSEWTEGSSLAEVAASHPDAAGAASAVAVLAAATEEAHRAGTDLGIDHPDRIRIATDGSAVLAFPATLPESDRPGDVHGLGAVLYALLTGEWPASADETSGRVGGLATALLGPRGLPAEPHAVRSEIPFEISAVAMRAIQGDSGIRTAATVEHVLTQTVQSPAPRGGGGGTGPRPRLRPHLRRAGGDEPAGDAAETPAEPTAASGRGEPGAEQHDETPARPGTYRPPARASAGAPGSPARTDPAAKLLDDQRTGPSRRTMLTVLAGLVVAVIAVVIFIMFTVGGVFGGGSSAPATQWDIGLTDSASPSPQPPAQSPEPPPPPAGVPAQPAKVTVYSPQGVPDDPRGAAFAIDGDPGTAWATDQYFQQLPALKDGVGLMLTFDHPVTVTKVGIDSPSPGTHVEIRTAAGANSPVADTVLIGAADITGDRTEITTDPGDGETDHVLVWLTRLGDAGSRFQSKIADITVDVQG